MKIVVSFAFITLKFRYLWCVNKLDKYTPVLVTFLYEMLASSANYGHNLRFSFSGSLDISWRM